MCLQDYARLLSASIRCMVNDNKYIAEGEVEKTKDGVMSQKSSFLPSFSIQPISLVLAIRLTVKWSGGLMITILWHITRFSRPDPLMK